MNEHGNIKSSFDYFNKYNLSKDSKILDIGCNFGSLIFLLHESGYKNIQGIDINLNSIEEGKNKYEKISERINYYDGEKVPFEDNTFDVVLMFDVIEHIPNIDKFLKNEVVRVLKRGGCLIFQTPNKYINIPWEVINQKSFLKYKEYHYSLQTKKSLKKLLEYSRFKDIIIEKNNVLTEHNKNKVEKKLGFFGLMILYFLSILPLFIFPNLWVIAKK